MQNYELDKGSFLTSGDISGYSNNAVIEDLVNKWFSSEALFKDLKDKFGCFVRKMVCLSSSVLKKDLTLLILSSILKKVDEVNQPEFVG